MEFFVNKSTTLCWISQVLGKNLQICHKICKCATLYHPKGCAFYLQICRFFAILKITCSILAETIHQIQVLPILKIETEVHPTATNVSTHLLCFFFVT